MEENRNTKNSLLTFFLIIAIIVIIIMGIIIFKLYSEKTEQIKKSSDLQTQVSSLNETVSNLKGTIDNISETMNSNNLIENDNTSNINNNDISFTEEQVKTALSNYLELDAHAGCEDLLSNLTEKGKLNYDSYKDNILNDGTVITNIKFTDYKNAMLNYVSENEFEKNWTKTKYFNENSNGFLTKTQGGGALRTYTIKNVIRVNDSTYSAKTTSVVDENEYFEEEEFTFTVISNNGKCVIDSINKK